MDCRTFHKSLEDYLEGGLDFPGRFGVERHAQQCLGCGKDLVDAQKISHFARELNRFRAPVDFEAQVHRRIQSRGLHRRPKLWKLQHIWWNQLSARSLAWGTAALALLIGGVYYSVNWLAVNRDTSNPSFTARNPLPESAPPSQASRLPVHPPDAPPRGAGPQALTRLYPSRSPDGPFVLESDAPTWSIEPGDTEYVECVVPAAGGQQLVMRLPKRIRMQHGQPSEEYFIRNVSH